MVAAVLYPMNFAGDVPSRGLGRWRSALRRRPPITFIKSRMVLPRRREIPGSVIEQRSRASRSFLVRTPGPAHRRVEVGTPKMEPPMPRSSIKNEWLIAMELNHGRNIIALQQLLRIALSSSNDLHSRWCGSSSATQRKARWSASTTDHHQERRPLLQCRWQTGRIWGNRRRGATGVIMIGGRRSASQSRRSGQ